MDEIVNLLKNSLIIDTARRIASGAGCVVAHRMDDLDDLPGYWKNKCNRLFRQYSAVWLIIISDSKWSEVGFKVTAKWASPVMFYRRASKMHQGNCRSVAIRCVMPDELCKA